MTVAPDYNVHSMARQPGSIAGPSALWAQQSLDQGVQRDPGDDKVIARFYTRWVRNNAASREKGIPVFEPVTYVSVIIPGNGKENSDRPIRLESDPTAQVLADQLRWPAAWQTFLMKKDQQSTGIPIEQCPAIFADQAAMLAEVGIFTVEVLASLDDGQCLRFGPMGVELRATARRHLESNGTIVADLQAQVTSLKQQLEAASGAVNAAQSALRAQTDELTATRADATAARQHAAELTQRLEAMGKPNPLHSPAEAAQHAQRMDQGRKPGR